ncbi:hypothetical protein [Sabulicella glaciei]|uniref:Uncharacterized protein n=1 Tax=Sabulicella glaciei TaxID=2984948 RepID=A0ABT3NPL0_9PROT|nr:hypothetical protein [Roseococcus sp. MDT2-1-1]MCW8084101.1 hypothetical protein [Roseococcus sp. MDT2-1-1]
MTDRIRRRAALLAPLSVVAFCLPGAAQDNPLVQRGVPAEATADNAVQARDRAFASARRIAWQRLQAATGASGSPSDSQLESMVSAIVVEEERTTPTRYVGRLTVQFASGTAGLSRPSGGGGGVSVSMAPVANIEAAASFGSLGEWLELRRRLLAAEPVAGVEVMSIAINSARLRLSLRAQPGDAQGGIFAAGVLVDGDGPSWRVGLAPGR